MEWPKVEFNEKSAMFNNGGIELVSMKEWGTAIQTFQQALEKSSDNPDIYYNLGVLYLKMGEFAKAFQNFMKALKISPKCVDLWHGVVLALCGLKRGQGIYLAIKMALKADPGYYDKYNWSEILFIIIATPEMKEG
jgi:tetratricopeptide (TPR) repeat protein